MTDRILSKDDVFAELRTVFATEFGFAESTLAPETHIVRDLDLDSIDFVDMAVALEARLGRKLKEEDLGRIRTLQDIVDVIHAGFGAPPV